MGSGMERPFEEDQGADEWQLQEQLEQQQYEFAQQEQQSYEAWLVEMYDRQRSLIP
jgi:hypothetical protein